MSNLKSVSCESYDLVPAIIVSQKCYMGPLHVSNVLFVCVIAKKDESDGAWPLSHDVNKFYDPEEMIFF